MSWDLGVLQRIIFLELIRSCKIIGKLRWQECKNAGMCGFMGSGYSSSAIKPRIACQ